MAKKKQKKNLSKQNSSPVPYIILSIVILLCVVIYIGSRSAGEKSKDAGAPAITNTNVTAEVNTTADMNTSINTSQPSKPVVSPENATKSIPSPSVTAENVKNDYAQLLQTGGYSKKDIDSARIYVERFISDVNQILTFEESLALQPGSNADENKPENLDVYKELSAKLDENKAVYFMLKLKNDFNGIDKVFDEYLLTLQIDLDIGDYLKDKDMYNKSRTEKLSAKNSLEFITFEQTERKALEDLQKQNEQNQGDLNPNTNKNNLPGGTNPNINPPVPNVPKVDVPRPIDPSEELKKKIGLPN